MPKQKIDLDFLFRLKFPGRLLSSPDGKKAAFLLAHSDEKDNSYPSNLWLYDGESCRRMSSDGKIRYFIWDDAETLLFPAERGKDAENKDKEEAAQTAFYRLSLKGGEAEPAFRLPLAVDGIGRIQKGLYWLTAAIDAEQPDEYLASCQERQKHVQEKKDKDFRRVLKEIPFWANGEGWIYGCRRCLFLFREEDRKLIRLTGPEMLLDAVQLDESNERLYVIAGEQRGRMPAKNGLHILDLSQGKKIFTLAEKALRELYPLSDFSFQKVWETAEGRLFVLGSYGKEYGLNESARLYELKEKKLLPLSGESFESYDSINSDVDFGGGPESFVRRGDFYYLASEREHSVIMRIDGEGRREKLYDAPGALRSLQPWENGFLAAGLLEMQPGELYCISEGKARRLSAFNTELAAAYEIAQPQAVEDGGTGIDGWLLYPANYDPAKRYPAIFDIHGGPRTAYAPVFFHEMQFWAAQGFFVLFCNPRGSSARGDAFADIRGQYGGVDYEDLMAFLDRCLEQFPQIDEERLGVTGGSYGGFMCNWILGHTQRFKAIATQRSIFNWLSFAGVSDIGYYFADDQAGCKLSDPDAFEKLWAHSPMRYIEAAGTPTLIIHSEEDYRCPVEQAYQLFTALKDRGVPTEMVLFKGENHELSRSGRPRGRRERLMRITEWMQHYVQGA